MTFPVTGNICFDNKDQIYNDHFPGSPIVPGSLILWAFKQALEKSETEINTFHLEHVRFMHFISPGTYSYTIHKNDDVYNFALYNNSRTIAKGIIRP